MLHGTVFSKRVPLAAGGRKNHNGLDINQKLYIIMIGYKIQIGEF